MMRFLFCGVAALTLAGCAGTGGYNDYQASREAELIGNAPGNGVSGNGVPAPAEVRSAPLGSGDPAIDAAEAALSGTAGASYGGASYAAAPQAVTNSEGISQENSFDAVSGERDIAQDAALIARNRAQYEVIQPTALPTRSGAQGPNIVQYALSTTNARGTPLYRRSTFRAETKAARVCAEYPSSDLAQEAFLAAGGPQKDRRGFDPDGDGFACAWDPAPYRAVRRN